MKLTQLKKIIKEEVTNVIKEGSFYDRMDDDAKALYREYIKKIDIWDRSAIYNHDVLDKALNADPRVQKNPGKGRLRDALSLQITYQETDR